MVSLAILLLSIILQFIAAFFALRLIPVTGKRLAWVAIAVALLLMSVRRLIVFYHILSGETVHTPDFIAEVVALIISAMMVFGLAYLAPFFISIVRTDEKLKLFRALIDHSNDSIFIVEPETGHLLDVNDTACETLGYEREELLGMDVADVEMVFQTEGAWREHLERVGKYGMIVFEGRHRKKDGESFPVERSVKFLNHDGREYIVAIVRDITKRKAAERLHLDQFNFLQTLIDTMPSPIFYKDAKGFYLGCNKAFESATGISKADIEGKTVFDLFPKDLADKYSDKDKELFENSGTQVYEYSIQYADNNMRDVIFNKAVYNNMAGEVAGIVGVITDITDHKRAEEDLKLARDDAEAASRAKSSFLATISHEVRTPLTVIIGVADLISETKLDEEQRRFIGILRESGEALLAQINDILDFSKVEADKVILHEAPFNLTELLATLCKVAEVKGTEPNGKAKAIKVICSVADDVPSMVVGAGDRLRQVLLNLVTNAVKFSGEEGEITIDAAIDKSVAEGCDDIVLLVSVKDTGIGIPPDRLDAIFDPFTQADDTVAREHGGSGLGLAISRRLAELMDGELYAESTVGKGSTFLLKVRLGIFKREVSLEDTPSSSGRDEEALEAGDARPLKILLAEDSEHIRFVVKTYLKDTSYTLDMAENGREAFELYKAGDYDIVLMDIQMPIVDGYKATANIRAYEEEKGLKGVPIVALTAHAFREQEEKSKAAGCTAHLVKPVSKKALLKVISQITKG